MKTLTVRKTLVPLAAGLLVSLLPFQVGFAQTDYSQNTVSTNASASATAIVSTNLESDGRSSGAKLADNEWRLEWEQRMNNWGRDWDSQSNDGNNDDNAQNDWNSRDQADAEDAIDTAEEAVVDFKAEIKQLQRDRAFKDEINDARQVLSSAKKELDNARRAYRKHNYTETTERAEHAIELISDWDDVDHSENRARRQAAVEAIENAEAAIDAKTKDLTQKIWFGTEAPPSLA